MNSAHASLLQWIQENPECSIIFWAPDKSLPYWVIKYPARLLEGKGLSYEAACYDLMQQLRKLKPYVNSLASTHPACECWTSI